jgi:hypothetical protein
MKLLHALDVVYFPQVRKEQIFSEENLLADMTVE